MTIDIGINLFDLLWWWGGPLAALALVGRLIVRLRQTSWEMHKYK